MPPVLETFTRLSACTVKFIRWLRNWLWRPAAWEEAVESLRRVHATL